jgi:tRNA(fMet)-specific endonuclease VapC
MKLLLDTDTCIHLLRGTAAVVARAQQHSPADFAISAITEYELLYGVERCPPEWQKKEGAKVGLLLGMMEVLAFTGETAKRAAKIRAALETCGNSIGPMDVLIAATALERDLPLVSGNQADFQRVPGLICHDWSREGL